MVPHLFLCLALVLLGVGLLQFRPLRARKAGLLVLWISTGVLVWALSGAWWAGAAGLLLWIAFPLWELVSVLRRLQIPRVRRLEDAFSPVGAAAFADLEPMTGEMEELGFRHVGDCDLLPAPQRQFFRLFDREDGLHQAFIGFIGEEEGGFHFAAFLSQDARPEGKNRYWMTWNYPLSYGLKTPPRLLLHRALQCATLEDLFDEHRELLRINGLEEDGASLRAVAGLEAVRRRLETVLARQLHYNVQVGVLTRQGVGDGFRYSWRGAFRVAGEVFRDLARL